MAGGKETPRQRMIGILYLVLLGLIALSIPDSLLEAFKNITDSLDRSRANVTTGIQNTYKAFEATKLKEQPERAKPIYDKAKKASQIAESLNSYVESLKQKLIAEGGGINEDTKDVDARDDIDISPRLMITQKNGEMLKKKIDETRAQLLSLLDEKDRATVNFSLNATDPPRRGDIKKDWQEANFGEGIPLGATLTTLAKIQADTKNAENEVVKKILGEVDQAVVNLDQFAAVAVAPTSYVIAGQPYTADLFLTAYDSRSNPTITVNGQNIPVDAGKGKYSVTTSKEGVFTWTGKISYKKNDGTLESKEVTQTYQVARPSAVVSPDKMNVFYIGVPNPVSISAPGIAKDKIKVSMTNGTIRGANGQYTVTVSNPGDATVTVSGEIMLGKTTVLGATNFRVKRIPPPKAQFAGKSGGVASAANIKAQDYLIAKLDNFDFDAKFRVTRFTLLIAKPRQDPIKMVATGDELSAAMHQAMNSITPGTTVVFMDIIAVGPDGNQVGLDPIVLNAN